MKKVINRYCLFVLVTGLAVAASTPRAVARFNHPTAKAAPVQTSSPVARSGHGLAFDSRRRFLLLYGGVDGRQRRLGDLWQWDGARWIELASAGPGPRQDAQMAYDSRRGRLVLFGGMGEQARQGDTWEWDGAQWRRAATAGPEARNLGAMAYDEARGRVVLFGGQNAARQRFGDTWEWDGQQWSRGSETGPSPRGSHAMTYHAGRKKVMLLGGYDGQALGDLWEWDGRAWRQVASTGLPPRMHFAFGYDQRRARLLVFGGFGESERIGDLWEWDGTVWRQAKAAGPAARAEHDGVYFPGRGFVIFGGIVGQGMDVAERDRVNDLWLWNGTNWKQAVSVAHTTAQAQLMNVAPPTARSLHAEVRGNGAQHLLLIPCAGCDWRSWETFMARNRRRYTMHAVTLPGLGGTARWPVAANAGGTPLMEHCATEIARYLREKRLRNVAIVGHSFGAAVALKTLLDHPASVAKLFLVDWGAVHPATLNSTPEERLQQAEARRAATLQQTDEAFRKQMMEMPATAIANAARVPVYAEMFGGADRLASAQISYELRRYDWRARLGEVTIPVAAVFGLPTGEEAETAKREAHAVLQGIRKLQTNFLPQTGHWVMEERPLEFDRLLKEFLSGTQPTRRSNDQR